MEKIKRVVFFFLFSVLFFGCAGQRPQDKQVSPVYPEGVFDNTEN